MFIMSCNIVVHPEVCVFVEFGLVTKTVDQPGQLQKAEN